MTEASTAERAAQLETGRVSPSYQTIARLRDAHLALQRANTEQSEHSARVNFAEQIRAFLSEARKAGYCLSDTKERKAAQAILDYWSAELAALPGAGPKDFKLVLLEEFDPASPRREAFPSGHADKSDQRSLIRLVALARQWRETKRREDYLLLGSALDEVMRFRGRDAGLDEFITASEIAQKEAKRRTFLVIITAVLSGVLVTSTLFAAHFYLLPILSDWETKRLKNPTTAMASQERALRNLALFQPWMPPAKSIFDLGAVKLEGITLPSLRLHAPNFVQAKLKKVDFRNAQFPNAAFHESIGIEESHFGGADLSFAQFRKSSIFSTSFSGAVLYRASFDGARLCGVDFSGADLRLASFENVTLGSHFSKHFRNTAWWLALGWSSQQIVELSTQEHPDLAKSRAFLDDRARTIKDVEHAPVGTFDRAVALNGLAWTLATYGVDLTPAKQEPGGNEEPCTKRTRIPTNALEAAKQAVCIIEALNGDEETYLKEKANAKDTLGYILMQANMASHAKDHLRTAAQKLQTGEVLFRYAVAQFANDELAEAKVTLKRAIVDEQYLPSHERKNLKNYITGELEKELQEQLQTRLSTPRPGAPCPE